MGLGFTLELFENPSMWANLEVTNSNEELLSIINKTIGNIKKIKTKTIINEYCETIDLITQAIKSNFEKAFEILIYKYSNKTIFLE
jgi:hypothetical protein